MPSCSVGEGPGGSLNQQLESEHDNNEGAEIRDETYEVPTCGHQQPSIVTEHSNPQRYRHPLG